MKTKFAGLGSVIKRMVGTHQVVARRRHLGGHKLPKVMLDGSWTALEAAGVRRLEERDDLFDCVELPPGWSIRPTAEGSIWSDLLDGTGRKRAIIFYKRGLCHRDAHMRPCTRYKLCSVWDADEQSWHYQVRDGEKVLYSTNQISQSDTVAEQAPLQDASGETNRRYQSALDWAENHFPLWHDVQAYWDDQDKAA